MEMANLVADLKIKENFSRICIIWEDCADKDSLIRVFAAELTLKVQN